MSQKQALFWHQLDKNRVHCHLCPHGCKIREGGAGLCRVRRNEGGVLYTMNYGEAGSLALDPVEKKPLYHFHPDCYIVSVGTVGCNLACGFCQNFSLVQGNVNTSYISPEELVTIAETSRPQNNIGIAYTYSEPGMWYEFVLDTARLAHSRGLKNVLVTNGYIETEPLTEMLPFIDAMNIDLKAFTQEFYRRICKARLAPVMKTIEICQARTHVEITTLLIPGLNDSPEEIEQLASWLASLDNRIVLHLSRYHPARHFRLPPTPLETMKRAREAAMRYLKYVYMGNIGGFDNNTRCDRCGNLLIERLGYLTQIIDGRDGYCSKCGTEVPFIW